MSKAVTSKQVFADYIAHEGNMVLVDEVVSWREQSITCVASSHTQVSNPLAVLGEVSIFAGVEYAAQAMAAHAWLLSKDENSRPSEGFVAASYKIKSYVRTLSEVKGLLIIEAVIVDTFGDSSLYDFIIHESEDGNNPLKALLKGRLLVVTQ